MRDEIHHSNVRGQGYFGPRDYGSKINAQVDPLVDAVSYQDRDQRREREQEDADCKR